MRSTGWGAVATIHSWLRRCAGITPIEANIWVTPTSKKFPFELLLNPEYIRRYAGRSTRNEASKSDAIRPGSLTGVESSETTHFSIVDKAGNAVALRTH